MKLIKQLVCLVAITSFSSQAQDTETQLIKAALNDYIQGTSYSRQKQILNAFTDDAVLLLQKKDMPIWEVPVKEYASWFNPEHAGKFNGRIGEILSIEHENGIAMAKVEILMPNRKTRFVDMFLMKKFDDGWKITVKTAAKKASENHGKRILFIVSSAHFHGDSKLRAGVSFGELVNAYDAFKKGGYTVDFVSPEGGATPLSYIDTSEPLHKKYLYNQDFMWGLANAKSPDQINPADFRAVYYLGGSNAMYQVPENKALQNIAMEIYEKHNGVVSAVCHGTAGIVNLKTANGNYLVKGKRISGYPDEYERKESAYYKEYPFKIDNLVESRGGDFNYKPRGVPHVEVDSRVVTGQNYQSSKGVAEETIKILDAQKS